MYSTPSSGLKAKWYRYDTRVALKAEENRSLVSCSCLILKLNSENGTYFNRTTVRTVPSVKILRTKLKSPTKIDPSGAVASATGARSLCLYATPSQSVQSSGR